MNPFRADTPADRTPEPATIVIFGASGDLTKRKLVPAIYNLMVERNLSRVAIVGTSRSAITDDEFRKIAYEGISQHSRKKPIDEDLWQTLAPCMHSQQGGFVDPEAFIALRKRLEEVEAEHNLSGNRLFYLSTPPSVFAPIIRNLGIAGLVEPGEDPFARVIIEKPFGRDLESAQALNHEVHQVLTEDQVFRIDHYLGKETVQNLLVFRFANGIFEPLWNSKYVDHVQITGAETLGVEGRGGYFENAGILRDMVQNHLMQVLCLAGMEPPVSFDANAVRDEKLKVIKALRPVDPDNITERVVRGQYAAGGVLGTPVPGYLEEPGVDPESMTETFVAMKLFVDNWRWAGVPFYLRSSKRMPKRVTEIAIHFKSAPHRLFGEKQMADLGGNVLTIRIQPDEGITLGIGSKVPGQANEIAPVTMEFRYASSFGAQAPEAYERLLLDALNGDGTLFTRGDEVEASWKFITPIHEAWKANSIKPEPYEAGSWGPKAAHDLVEADGRRWRKP
jgi:glucose-6-phosphate 1-dehydrogenase